jgi:hypothetical protein
MPPVNKYSPALIYSNKDRVIIKTINILSTKYDNKNKLFRKIFWFIRLGSFESFLSRRSETSTRPDKHFPTIETYEKIKKKVNATFQVTKFNKDRFCTIYDNLKKETHLTGREIIDDMNKKYPQLPQEWIQIGELYANGEVVSIALLIDDNKSMSLVNIAAKRSSNSYGIYLCTEVVKYCCERRYYSFDAGVSGIYGVYKDKIYLDSYEIKSSANIISKIRYLTNKLIS